MSINLKKFKYVSWEISHLVWNRDTLKNTSNKPVRVWNRKTFIDPTGAVSKYIVYKGNKWVRFSFSKLRNINRVGEFAFTRKPFYHPYNKKKNK